MDLIQETQRLHSYLSQIRRRLHETPEVSGQEIQTLALVRNELEDIGIPYVEVPDGGILGFIRGGEGKGVLLRADLDALPIEESPWNLRGPKVCVSKVPGVSHACGHDAHTAMLLTEARILFAHKDELPGSVVLLFERGEEATRNIRNVVPYLEAHPEIKIDTCFATHVRWDVPAGKIAVLDGPVMSGDFTFSLRLTGHGGHGSRPDLANNPVDCFVSIYQALTAVRMREVDPSKSLTFSLGKLSAGQQPNVIPGTLDFAGTARYFDSEGAGEPFARAFRKIVQSQAELFGCTVEPAGRNSCLYETANHPVCAALARDAVTQYAGSDALVSVDPWMASETFGILLKLYPGVLVFTGIQNEVLGSGANHHTPEFDVDEDGLMAGVRAAVGYTLEFMKRSPEIPFTRAFRSMEDLVNHQI